MASLITLLGIIAVAAVFWQERSAGISPAPTLPQMARMMMEQCPVQVQGDILELGCGWGGLALKLAAKYPQNNVIGYEMSWVPYLVSSLREKIYVGHNLKIVRGNFYDVPFNNAGLVMCYLSPQHMVKLEEKFLRELPTGAQVISSTFYCPTWTPIRTQDVKRLVNSKIFVYEKNV